MTPPSSNPGENQLSGSVRSYAKENDRLSWTGAGEQGLQHAFEQRDCVGLISHKEAESTRSAEGLANEVLDGDQK